MPRLRQGNGQVRRGRHRSAGLRARPLPGSPARAAEICLHRLRCDYAGTGSGDAHSAWSRHPRDAGAFAGVEILRSSAAVSEMLRATFAVKCCTADYVAETLAEP